LRFLVFFAIRFFYPYKERGALHELRAFLARRSSYNLYTPDNPGATRCSLHYANLRFCQIYICRWPPLTALT
jgi:hypothetical protein